MKVVALQNFADKDNFAKKYLKGESYEFSEERAKELLEKGVVVLSEASEEEKEKIANLEEREAAVVGHESNLALRESALEEKENLLIEKERELNEKAEALSSREAALSRKEAKK